MKILVTGGNGFVGREVVKELRRQGHFVKVFDLPDDLRDFSKVDQAVKGMDVVYHLAALLDESKGKKELFSVNVEGTKNVLDACCKKGIHQFIYLGSVGVMGEVSGKANEYSPYNPATNYEKSKAEAEKLVLSYQEMLPVTVLRSALVYGSNSYWKKIIKLALKKFPLIGSGENLFQMIHLHDLVSALLFVSGKEETLGELYIVAEEKASTYKEVYAEICRNLGIELPKKSIPVVFAKLMSYFYLVKSKLTGKKSIILPQHIDRLTRQRNYDITKIKLLGWKPNYSLSEGIREMIEEFRQRKEL